MAKKAPKKEKSDVPVVLTAKDKKTLSALREFAGSVAQSAERGRAPNVDIPSRSLSNVKYNQSRRIIEMGSGTNRRELFNLSQAKAYMQTLLVGSGAKRLIEEGKTTSLRGLYYMLKHTIDGTKEETFDDQAESDTMIEDVEVTLEALREELHLYAKSAGSMVGPLTLVDSGDEIDCSRMGSGGYTIPSICEPEVVQIKRCDAKFILHVEKDTVWRRFNEDKFWQKYKCILTPGHVIQSRAYEAEYDRRHLRKVDRVHHSPLSGQHRRQHVLNQLNQCRQQEGDRAAQQNPVAGLRYRQRLPPIVPRRGDYQVSDGNAGDRGSHNRRQTKKRLQPSGRGIAHRGKTRHFKRGDLQPRRGQHDGRSERPEHQVRDAQAGKGQWRRRRHLGGRQIADRQFGSGLGGHAS